MKRKSKKLPSSIITPELREMAKRIQEIHKTMKQNGLFIDDRELLTCPKCCLEEDVAFNGMLFTYRKDDPKHKDTGLKFITLDDKNKRFKCPSCNTKIIAPKPDIE